MPGETIQLPLWTQPFFDPYRYKIAYGGRGGGKSWAFADIHLIRAAGGYKQIVCGREFQNSMKESVHQLLHSRIKKHAEAGRWKESDWHVTHDRITNKKTGSFFTFIGLRRNPDAARSLEGATDLWIEEGHRISRRSLKILVPTIRQEGSEIWIAFNPENIDDPVYADYVLNPDPDMLVAFVNWWDNPFYPSTLHKERVRLYKRDPILYQHVYNGGLIKHSAAAVFNKCWTVEQFTPDPKTWGTPRFGVDWGFAGAPTVAVKVWDYNNVLYVEHEVRIKHRVEGEKDISTASLNKRFDAIPDMRRYRVSCDSARPELVSQLKYATDLAPGTPTYPLAESVKKGTGSIEGGIDFIKNYRKVVIHPRCKGIEFEAKHYRFEVDDVTGDVTDKIIDANNDGWDAIRYANEPKMLRQRSTLWSTTDL